MSHGRRIGRVKIITPSKEVAEKYLSTWVPKDLHFKPDSFPKITGENFFSKDQTVNIEIGCGTGEYLVSLSKENPDKLYIGIENSKRSVYYAVDLAQKAKLDNIHFIFSDFRRIYPYLVPNTVDIFYFHFPDPNYGQKNEKKKIFTENFLKKIHPVFSNQGYLSVVTDQEELLEEYLEVIANVKNYHRIIKENVIEKFSPNIKSRFHKAWKLIDRPILHFKLYPQND